MSAVFNTRLFPNELKVANSIPLYKKGETYHMTSFVITWTIEPLCRSIMFILGMSLFRAVYPRGSILGPLLFLIYINGMDFVSNQSSRALFADDANLFDTNIDLKALIKNVNSELHKIMNWCNANKLYLNIHNTHFILLQTVK